MTIQTTAIVADRARLHSAAWALAYITPMLDPTVDVTARLGTTTDVLELEFQNLPDAIAAAARLGLNTYEKVDFAQELGLTETSADLGLWSHQEWSGTYADQQVTVIHKVPPTRLHDLIPSQRTNDTGAATPTTIGPALAVLVLIAALTLLTPPTTAALITTTGLILAAAHLINRPRPNHNARGGTCSTCAARRARHRLVINGDTHHTCTPCRIAALTTV